MTLRAPYTTHSLEQGDPRFLPRTPGLRDVMRLFPAPVSVGKGHLGVEGGVTLVGAPGLGKTSLLRHLKHALEQERQMPAALVKLPPIDDSAAVDSFPRYLALLVAELREQLLASPLVTWQDALLPEPPWDGGGDGPAMTPRGLERWVRGLGQRAAQAHGLTLLFDDLDRLSVVPWRVAFVAALRFIFQAAAGLTPVYATWRLYFDESLPGSNYFRNVTRPIFLGPLDAAGERSALVDLGLPALPPPTRARLFELAGGHPRLLHQILSDLDERLGPGAEAELTPDELDRLLAAPAGEGARGLVAELITGSPALPSTLAAIGRGRYRYAELPRSVTASGLVDRDPDGHARVPLLVSRAVGA
jgi:energy-coupling factor transporter ATP-binding protein EcfA2